MYFIDGNSCLIGIDTKLKKLETCDIASNIHRCYVLLTYHIIKVTEFIN